MINLKKKTFLFDFVSEKIHGENNFPLIKFCNLRWKIFNWKKTQSRVIICLCEASVYGVCVSASGNYMEKSLQKKSVMENVEEHL